MKNKKQLFITFLLSLILFSAIGKPFIPSIKPPTTFYTAPPSTDPGGDDVKNP